MRDYKKEIADLIAKNPLDAREKFDPAKFCYWSIGDSDYAHMIQGCVASARMLGVKQDFHVYTDIEIKGAPSHPCGKFDKYMWLFKLTFLRDMVSNLDYDYFVFFDADSFFVRNPGEFIADLVKSNPVFVQMESLISSPKVHRDSWWTMLPADYIKAIRELCPKPLTDVYNTNAGFFVVRRDAVKLVYELAMLFWNAVKEQNNIVLSEEAPLAFVGHVLQSNVDDCTVAKSGTVWASEWCSHFKGRLPDAKPWIFEDYMCGEKIEVNPAIIHSMHNDPALIVEGKKYADPAEPVKYIAIKHINDAAKSRRPGYLDIMRLRRDQTKDNDHAGMWGYTDSALKAVAAWVSRSPQLSAPLALLEPIPKPKHIPKPSKAPVPLWEIRGPGMWAELHGRADLFTDAETENKWLAVFDAGIGCGECRTHWREMMKRTPPDLSNADAYFAWGIARHNEVNARLTTKEKPKRQWTVEESTALYRKSVLKSAA